GYHFFRNITPKSDDNLLFKDNASDVYHRHSYYPLEIEEKKFDERVLNYFKGEKLEKIIDIPINEAYHYFDLPFYAERNPGNSNPTLVGLLTLVYPSDYASLVQDREFMKFMQFFSEQLSIAWDNLQEYIALKIQGRIDQQIKSDRKEGYRSRDQELHSISQILAEEFDCHLCCFFLENPRKKTLSLDSANIPIEHPITYDLQTDTQVLSVRSYNSKLNFRVFGRQRVEQLADSQKIMIIEEETRKACIMDDPVIDNWLSVLIAIGDEKLGLIKLFRLKSRKRAGYQSPPFSEFETNLLNRIQKHIFNILITHHTIRQRMEEMHDFLHLVMSPLNALIAASSNLVDGIASAEKIPEKSKILLSLSRTAAHYVRNYRRIFELESRQVQLELDEIHNLKQYLTDLVLVYQPYIEKKYICIHVTEQTKDSIKIRFDKELFDLVILNLLDNAVKYSFHAEERAKIGLQAKPANDEDQENVLLTALESGDEVIITISNWGLEIPDDEKEQVFKREFRGQKARMSITGTGIGLYIAREIVQLHEGTLELVPTDHKNHTLFKITLPKNLRKEVI
ncbi:MAG: two-component system, OmpR family, sensor histidine kinase CiaH, partial [Acidobacteriota bacterium]|nr:two-component system, OmpR family, sensor histidine kinase CiaH [Acidobacteriota bacterium]